METSPRVEESADHICISLDPSPDVTPHALPVTTTLPHHITSSTMHSDPLYSASAYPRPADSDSEDIHSDSSSQKMDEEDPLCVSRTHSSPSSQKTPTVPSPFSPPPHSPHSAIPPPTSHPHPPPSPFLPSPHSPPSSPPQVPVLRHQSSISDDLLCTICTSVLHDPVSLHCGHSFCQLCLAAMWRNNHEPRSAANLSCPVCRSPWRNFPGVNIQLRNVIERTYPEKIAERDSDLLPEDHELLARFKRARDRESQLKDKEVPQLRREEIRRLVIGLGCIFIVILALMVMLFTLLLWVVSGAGGEYMRKPASQWTREDVAEWVGGLGNWATNNYSKIFLGEHITGQRLLQLDEAALMAIEIKNGYRRQSILSAIEELREAEFSTPRNFREFKAAHRRQTLVIAMFYSIWPRLTLFYVYSFNYYEVFLPFMRYHFPSHKELEEYTEPGHRELAAMFIEMLLIPHFLVASFAWGWAGLYPWIAYPVIIHCVWCMWVEGKTVVGWVRSGDWTSWELANWRIKVPQFCWTILLTAIKQSISFIGLFFIASVLWHITPHFICDIVLYYLVWQTVIHVVCGTALVRCVGLVGRNNFRAQIRMNIGRPQHVQQQRHVPNP